MIATKRSIPGVLVTVVGVLMIPARSEAQPATQGKAPRAAAHGTVFGQVTRPDGSPIPDARVTLFLPDLSVFVEARADELGAYRLEDVASGDYRIGASARGLEYLERGISLRGANRQDFVLGPETNIGRWVTVGSTLPEYLDATDIGFLQTDGKIFYCHDTTDPIEFDPVSGQKTFPVGSSSEQGCTLGTLLDDGRLLFVGGQSPADPGSFRDAVPWVKTFEPGVGWKRQPDLLLGAGRWYPGLARLADGSWIAMGGGTAPDASRTATCERFDPLTRSWSWTGSMLNPTEYPPSALLHNGLVLATWYPPQLYDPASGQWRVTGNFAQPDRGWPGHSDHSIVVLDDGRVLAIGTSPTHGGGTPNMAELYDPDDEIWSLVSSSELPRFQSEVVALPDGRILVAGGEAAVDPIPVEDVLGIVRWTDLYDPEVDVWRRVADMQIYCEYHAVSLLVPDGRVLKTGGTRIKFQVGPTSADIEAYEPPYLFRGVRPQIATLSDAELDRGEEVLLEIFPATQITSLILMGTSVHTHWVDGGIPRRVVLEVSQSGTSVRASLPADENVLPAGHYMLFAMVDDIPSVASIVRVLP